MKAPGRSAAPGPVDAFLAMMSAERGAAKNTLDAYGRDLRDYADTLSGQGRTVLTADVEAIRDWLAGLDAAAPGTEAAA